MKIFLLVLGLTAFSTSSVSAELLLYDDFSDSSLNSSRWGVGNWDLGRTQLGLLPTLNNSGGTTYATLSHNTYNPNAAGSKFLGSEIFSKNLFSRPTDGSLIFEARVRSSYVVGGLVTSFFSFDRHGTPAVQDELDFEVLTNNGNQVQLTAWNDFDASNPHYGDLVHHTDHTVAPTGFDATTWNTYRMELEPSKVNWYVNDSLVWTQANVVPNDPMTIRANFWAPDVGWAAAYNAALQPTSLAVDNVIFRYDIDYIRVSSVPEPSSWMPFTIMAAAAMCGRRRNKSKGSEEIKDVRMR